MIIQVGKIWEVVVDYPGSIEVILFGLKCLSGKPACNDF
jgi:hypothetical protein